MAALQEFLRIDETTSWFLFWYVLGLIALFALSAVLSKPKKERQEPQKSSQEPRKRPAIVEFGINLGMRFVHLVANSGVTPNQITVIGMVLVAFNCLVFAYTKNTFAFGCGLIAALLFDTLDGLVARTQGTSSLFGGYLDAVIDRYEEVLIYFTIGAVLDRWPEAFLVVTGSMLISYNKARVAIEMPIQNKGWSDLMQKPTRLFILCFALIGNPIVPWFLDALLWFLVVATYFTVIQRMMRVRFMMENHQ